MVANTRERVNLSVSAVHYRPVGRPTPSKVDVNLIRRTLEQYGLKTSDVPKRLQLKPFEGLGLHELPPHYPLSTLPGDLLYVSSYHQVTMQYVPNYNIASMDMLIVTAIDNVRVKYNNYLIGNSIIEKMNTSSYNSGSLKG